MHSNSLWRQQGGCLIFEGRWTHDSVSEAWHRLPRVGVERVDVGGVNQLDSAFLTLLLQLSPSQQLLAVKGATAALRSLVGLYNLNAVLMIEAETTS